MTTRYALYARYSSDRQSERSIDDQITLCRAEIARQGGEVVEVYTDYALSGATIHRPGLQALLADARAGRFEVVLTESLDRISRDQEDTAHIAKRLTFGGVRLRTVSEGEIGALHVGLKGTMNQLYLEDLAKKVRRGQAGRAAEGKAAGSLSYGYRVVKRIGPDGEPVRGEREIDPDQAAVVREIFASVAAGRSLRSIVLDLNRRGIPSAHGSDWKINAIAGHRARGTGILHNRLYIGELVYNRVRMVKDPDTGRRLSRVNPESEWTITQVPDLRIVDQDLWDTVQRQRRAAAQLPLSRRPRPKRLLSGLLACGVCGGNMTIVNRDAYGCPAHRSAGTCTNTRTIHAAEIERRVLQGLKEQMLSPAVIAEAVTAYQAERRRLQAEEAVGRRDAEKRLGDLTRQIERLVDRICEGTDTPASNARLKQLEAEKAAIEAAAEQAKSNVVKLQPDMADQYRAAVEELEQALGASEIDSDEAMSLVRGLIDRIVVHPGEHRHPGRSGSKDPCRLELHGRLATVLALARPNAVVGTGQKCTIQMVAGARYHPYRAIVVEV